MHSRQINDRCGNNDLQGLSFDAEAHATGTGGYDVVTVHDADKRGESKHCESGKTAHVRLHETLGRKT